MSFEVKITGHSPDPHAVEVKAIAVEATRKLLALGGTATLSGYVSDSAVSLPLSDADVGEAIALEQKALEQEEAPAEESTETSAEETAEETPAAETAEQPPTP